MSGGCFGRHPTQNTTRELGMQGRSYLGLTRGPNIPGSQTREVSPGLRVLQPTRDCSTGKATTRSSCNHDGPVKALASCSCWHAIPPRHQVAGTPSRSYPGEGPYGRCRRGIPSELKPGFGLQLSSGTHRRSTSTLLFLSCRHRPMPGRGRSFPGPSPGQDQGE